MIIFEQDPNTILQDSLINQADTSAQKPLIYSDTTAVKDTLSVFSDTVAVITEKQTDTKAEKVETEEIVTSEFFDSIFTGKEQDYKEKFPFHFIEKNRIREQKTKEVLIKHLREGINITENPFHQDWMIIMILISAFIYAFLASVSGKLVSEVKNFFLFRGKDKSFSDTSGLFQWQSTLFNLVSFINLSLFLYVAAVHYGITIYPASEILSWLIILVIIILLVTFRHIISLAAGNISGQRHAFNEYILVNYWFYRILSLVLFINTILLLYTESFPPGSLIRAGFAIIIILYLLRLNKLFFIFIKRNISILYLILYLCALEFLPVGVLIKYFTGLF
ncbi:MAG TPA: DUF4271 domain-containing protein [Bacteroidales bacterium]|nr:DUF4271 domain-containing protein [Bacteroidales bacterium]